MRFIDRGAGEYIDHLFDRLMGDRWTRKILDLDTTPAPSTRTGRVVLQEPARPMVIIQTRHHRVEFSRRRFSGFLADQQGLAHILRYVVELQRIDHVGFCQSFDGHPTALYPLGHRGDFCSCAHFAVCGFLHLSVKAFDFFFHNPHRRGHGGAIDIDPPLVDFVIELPQCLLRRREL